MKMAQLQAKQISKFLAGFIGLSGLAVTSANSVNVTSALTTALTSGGNGGASVPLQAAVANTTMGVIVAGDNEMDVFDNVTQQPVTISGQKVYARISLAGGVYTASFFVRTAGAETAQSINGTVQVVVPYLFDFVNYPSDSAIKWWNVAPASAGSGAKIKIEQLTVTATNTLSNMSALPADSSIVVLNINGADIYPTNSFSVSGQAITISAAQATATGYAINTTDTVFVRYSA